MAEELVYSGRIEGAMGGGGFDELRECAICHENYDQSSRVPRILECTHTLCEACLLNLIQVSPLRGSAYVKTASPTNHQNQ